MGDQECPLLREVMVEIGDDLYSNISLSRTRRTNNQSKTMLHTRKDGLHLSSCERHGIPADRHMQSGREHIEMRILGRNIWHLQLSYFFGWLYGYGPRFGNTYGSTRMVGVVSLLDSSPSWSSGGSFLFWPALAGVGKTSLEERELKQ